MTSQQSLVQSVQKKYLRKIVDNQYRSLSKIDNTNQRLSKLLDTNSNLSKLDNIGKLLGNIVIGIHNKQTKSSQITSTEKQQQNAAALQQIVQVSDSLKKFKEGLVSRENTLNGEVVQKTSSIGPLSKFFSFLFNNQNNKNTNQNQIQGRRLFQSATESLKNIEHHISTIAKMLMSIDKISVNDKKQNGWTSLFGKIVGVGAGFIGGVFKLLQPNITKFLTKGIGLVTSGGKLLLSSLGLILSKIAPSILKLMGGVFDFIKELLPNSFNEFLTKAGQVFDDLKIKVKDIFSPTTIQKGQGQPKNNRGRSGTTGQSTSGSGGDGKSNRKPNSSTPENIGISVDPNKEKDKKTPDKNSNKKETSLDNTNKKQTQNPFDVSDQRTKALGTQNPTVPKSNNPQKDKSINPNGDKVGVDPKGATEVAKGKNVQIPDNTNKTKSRLPKIKTNALTKVVKAIPGVGGFASTATEAVLGIADYTDEASKIDQRVKSGQLTSQQGEKLKNQYAIEKGSDAIGTAALYGAAALTGPFSPIAFGAAATADAFGVDQIIGNFIEGSIYAGLDLLQSFKEKTNDLLQTKIFETQKTPSITKPKMTVDKSASINDGKRLAQNQFQRQRNQFMYKQALIDKGAAKNIVSAPTNVITNNNTFTTQMPSARSNMNWDGFFKNMYESRVIDY